MVEKPSVELKALLDGRRGLNDVSDGVRSWARFYIYQAAEEILAMPSKNARREALEKVPDTIRSSVRDEVMRLWEIRK